MKYSLSKILESTILTEGRKEDAMKKHGASKELVDSLSAGDPSGNNKYLDWMTAQAMGKGEGSIPTADVIVKAIERYHKQVNRLNKDMAEEAGINQKATNSPKDIQNFVNVQELLKLVKVAEEKVTDKQVKKEADKVYEDDNVLVMSPLTVRASCKYGAGTKWCITSRPSGGGYNTHFDSYSKNAVFYFITDKTTDQGINPTHYKYALQYDHKGGKTWWDASDRSHQRTPDFMETESGRKAMEAVNRYHRAAVGEKLQREIKKYLLQPTSRQYTTYREHLTPEQRGKVINEIIKQEGATTQVLEALIKDLTAEQKDSLLFNLINLNTHSFNKIKEELSDEQLMNVIKNNPALLNGSDTINFVNEKLDDSDKFKLAKELDKSKVNNTDSKVTLKKWSMTPEQLAAHSENSTYVFLYDTINKEVEKIVKVDSLNPESYKIINSMKLRATMDRGLTLYAIRTEAGLLDEWDGKGGSEIPSSVLTSIMEKGQKI